MTSETKAMLQVECERLANLAQACMDTATAEDNEVLRLKDMILSHQLSRDAARDAAKAYRQAADALEAQIDKG